jgi:N-acetylglucosaminyldiphosphoundecaprenol N-acetyl-beta-D-mannosaminyltransferase
MTAQDDAEVGEFLSGADIVAPDGMPVVWALRSFGFKGQQRVYGPTAMSRLCADAARWGHRIFLYGGTEESLCELRRRLTERFPGLRIAGSYAPPFRPLTGEEDRSVIARIEECGADLVFVGISTPKQDRWMYEHRDRLPGVVLAGVGAAFDFHAGRVPQAPGWIQSHGLEWLFRLLMEPARLWRRYLLVTPRFLPLWAAQWMAWAVRGSAAGKVPAAAAERSQG